MDEWRLFDYALSSGFLIADAEVETVKLNSTAVKKVGHSVLLLPTLTRVHVQQLL